jgi:hypothetical protein
MTASNVPQALKELEQRSSICAVMRVGGLGSVINCRPIGSRSRDETRFRPISSSACRLTIETTRWVGRSSPIWESRACAS